MDLRVFNFWAEERPVYKSTYQLEGGEPCSGSLLSSGQRPRGSQGGRGGTIDHDDNGVAVEYSDDVDDGDDHDYYQEGGVPAAVDCLGMRGSALLSQLPGQGIR